MTDPSSSTPASPPTDKLEPEKECLKRIADFVWGFRVVGIDGQEVKDRGNFMLGVACGQLLDFEDNEEAVKAIQAYAASLRAASTGTAADFLKRVRWTHGALKAIRDEVCGCETMPRFITNPDCLDMVDNSALRWEVDWLTRQEFESIFPAPPVASQKGKEEE